MRIYYLKSFISEEIFNVKNEYIEINNIKNDEDIPKNIVGLKIFTEYSSVSTINLNNYDELYEDLYELELRNLDNIELIFPHMKNLKKLHIINCLDLSNLDLNKLINLEILEINYGEYFNEDTDEYEGNEIIKLNNIYLNNLINLKYLKIKIPFKNMNIVSFEKLEKLISLELNYNNTKDTNFTDISIFTLKYLHITNLFKNIDLTNFIKLKEFTYINNSVNSMSKLNNLILPKNITLEKFHLLNYINNKILNLLKYINLNNIDIRGCELNSIIIPKNYFKINKNLVIIANIFNYLDIPEFNNLENKEIYVNRYNLKQRIIKKTRINNIYSHNSIKKYCHKCNKMQYVYTY